MLWSSVSIDKREGFWEFGKVVEDKIVKSFVTHLFGFREEKVLWLCYRCCDVSVERREGFLEFGWVIEENDVESFVSHKFWFIEEEVVQVIISFNGKNLFKYISYFLYRMSSVYRM